MTVRPALEGIFVLELTEHVRGRYCGRLFAELGAHVVRMARPDSEHGGREGLWLDAGKEVVSEPDAGFAAWLGRADVLITDAPDGVAPRAAAAGHPALIAVSVTPFGLSGPWAGREAPDLIISALSGMAGINGYADGMPLREPGQQAEMVGALMGFIGALAALEEREQSGLGQLVESSCLEAMVNVLAPAVVEWSYTGRGPQQRQRGTDMLFQCADGWMSLYITANKAWETIVTVLDVRLEAGDERFASELSRRKHAAAMRDVLEPHLLSRTRKELFDLLSPMRVVVGMVAAPRDLLADEHLAARDAFVRVGADATPIPRVPIRTRGERLKPELMPALAPAPFRGAAKSRRPALPLEHIVVTDLTQAWAGSYATQLLADLGAKVIKIESRTRPDPWRGGFRGERGIQAYPSDGPGERPYNRMWLANSVNRNKMDITLDLSNPECRELFLALVRQSDVVAENFTPRVLPNFGLEYERLRQEKEDIILLSMPGYGLDGPYSDYPAIGGTIEPMSGNSALLGEPGGLPQTSGLMYPDAVAGLHGAAAVLAALRRKARTGAGSHMEISQHESMLSMTAPFHAHEWWETPAGNRAPAGGDARVEQGASGQWVASAGGLTEAVRSIAEVAACEHLAARGFFVDVEQVDIGRQTMAGVSPLLHRTPGSVRWGTPGHGQDSRRVLRELLGLDERTIDRLEAEGLTGEGPPSGWQGD